jgi:hypothetical protein
LKEMEERGIIRARRFRSGVAEEAGFAYRDLTAMGRAPPAGPLGRGRLALAHREQQGLEPDRCQEELWISFGTCCG